MTTATRSLEHKRRGIARALIAWYLNDYRARGTARFLGEGHVDAAFATPQPPQCTTRF